MRAEGQCVHAYQWAQHAVAARAAPSACTSADADATCSLGWEQALACLLPHSPSWYAAAEAKDHSHDLACAGWRHRGAVGGKWPALVADHSVVSMLEGSSAEHCCG